MEFIIPLLRLVFMRVFVNDREVTVYNGAIIQDVVLAYSKHCYKMMKSGYLKIYDRFGFLTEPDGPAADGQRFYLKITEK